jgi:hypothetical protein
MPDALLQRSRKSIAAEAASYDGEKRKASRLKPLPTTKRNRANTHRNPRQPFGFSVGQAFMPDAFPPRDERHRDRRKSLFGAAAFNSRMAGQAASYDGEKRKASRLNPLPQ